MLLRSALHLHQKRFSVLSLTQDIEDSLSVILHYPELLSGDIRDIRDRKLRENYLKEFNENIFPCKTQKCGEMLQNREWLLKIFTILKF